MVFLPRVEALRTSTLGYEIATPLPFRVAMRRAGDLRFRVAVGCAPSTISPILTFPKGKKKSQIKGPIPAFFKKRSEITTSSNTARTNSRPLGRVREGLLISCFFYRQRRSFFTAAGRFLNHAGCCRHAKHGVGDGGDDKEENEFSDWRHRQTPKRRSRQHPPWLFVFISATNRSN